MARPKKNRLNRKVDEWLRDALGLACDLTGATYAQVGRDLRKGPRWCRNALSRTGTLTLEAARDLMKWIDEAVSQHGDQDSLSQVRFLAAHLRDIPRSHTPVPILVLDRDIDRVSATFDRYAKSRGRSQVKGLLRDFLTRSSVIGRKPGAVGTYARSCAWALSQEVRETASRKWKTQTLKADGRRVTYTPDDLQTIVYGLEGITDPEKLPRATRKQRNAAR